METDIEAEQPAPVLVAIGGPTASGKSTLAVDLARHFGGEVINCDAMQVYRGFDIGTAKLPVPERRGVPHHLIDICEPGETFSAGDFAARARRCARDIAGRGRIPILAGGTGFYQRAFLTGLFEAPKRDEAARNRLKEREMRRPGSTHRILSRLDPDASRRIHPNDTNKVIRALEVYLTAGRPITELQQTGRRPLEGFRVVKLFLDPDRSAVYARINQRCQEMFQHGLIEEVRSLLEQGISRSAQPFLGVGYREALAALDGSITLDRAIELAQQATRRYAKRQWTWFRREEDYMRLAGFGDNSVIREQAIKAVGELPKMRGEVSER